MNKASAPRPIAPRLEPSLPPVPHPRRRLVDLQCSRTGPVATASLSVDIARLRQIGGCLNPVRIDGYVLAVLLLPLILLLLDSNVFFAKAGWLDTWIYYSHFQRLKEFKSVLFPNTYYASRMSWILPGYVINHMFPPLAANYILHLTVCYTAALSLWDILRRLYGRLTATLSVFAFVCNPYLWGAVGADYVDGFGIACYLLTLAILIRARDAARLRAAALFAAGAVGAALIYTNTIWLLFSPAFLALYLFPRRPGESLTSTAGSFCLWFAAGGAALTAVIGVINYRIDGQFWFYLPSIQYTLANANKPQPWHSPTYEWVWTAHWLIYPAAVLLMTLVGWTRWIVTRNRDGARPETGMFRAHFVSLLLIFVLLELKGMYMLEWAFYASYLIPAAFLTVGSGVLAVEENRRGYLLVLAAAVAFLTPWTTVSGPVWSAISDTKPAFVLGVAVAAILVRAALPRNQWALASCLFGFCLFTFYLRGTVGYAAEQAENPNGARDAFVRMTRTVDAIDETRQGRPVVFWFNAQDPRVREFDSINSFFLWGYTWIGRAFPEIDPVANERVKPGRMVAVLSSTRDAQTLLEEANRALKPRGLAVTLLAEREIRYGAVRYGLTCMDLVRDPDLLEPLHVSFAPESGDGILTAATGAAALPLEKWRAADKDAAVMASESGLRIRTGGGSHVSYGAMYAGLIAPEDGRYLFSMKYRLLDGHVAFGALREDRNSWLGQVADMPPAGRDNVMEYLVDLRKGQRFWLLTTNNRPRERDASIFIMREVRAFRYRDRAPATF